MTPPNLETSTDARSKSRVELAPTMLCKKEEDQRSTRDERQAYVREKWECMHNCELCGKLKDSPSAKPYLDKIGFSEEYELLYCIALGYPDETPEAKPRTMDKIKYME